MNDRLIMCVCSHFKPKLAVDVWCITVSLCPSHLGGFGAWLHTGSFRKPLFPLHPLHWQRNYFGIDTEKAWLAVGNGITNNCLSAIASFLTLQLWNDSCWYRDLLWLETPGGGDVADIFIFSFFLLLLHKKVDEMQKGLIPLNFFGGHLR